MIYKRTTLEKFTNAIKMLEGRGGRIDVQGIDGDDTAVICGGVASLRILGFDVALEFLFADGEASFKITKKPFFVTDDQIAKYVLAALE